MPPVIILNGLFCTDSRLSSSVSVQLQNTILAYSRPGRMKEVYIVVKVFLSNKYFSLARIFNFLPAFSLIVMMWSFHERVMMMMMMMMTTTMTMMMMVMMMIMMIS